MFRARLPALAALLSSLALGALIATACASNDDDVTVTKATETNFFTPECKGDACSDTQLKCPAPDEAPPPDAGAPPGECPPPAAN